MRVVDVRIVNGETEITIERRAFIFFKMRERYITTGKIAGDFYNWVKAPSNVIVPDLMSFQLNEWKKIYSTVIY